MKKGFTLVELLAVIAIIGIISAIAVPSAFSLSKKIKKNMYCEKVSMILNEAKRWGTDHSSQLRSTCYVARKVSDFVQDGFIKKETTTSGRYIINPYTDQSMDANYVYLYKKNNIVYAWYGETNAELKTACESSGIESSRPSSKC